MAAFAFTQSKLGGCCKSDLHFRRTIWLLGWKEAKRGNSESWMTNLEVIRIIALFCIVYNHIGYVLFEGFENPFKITVSVILSVLLECS